MQSDNNLVIYDSTMAAIWASGTNSVPSYFNCHLQMRDDGNLVIYAHDGITIFWQTNTTISIYINIYSKIG